MKFAYIIGRDTILGREKKVLTKWVRMSIIVNVVARGASESEGLSGDGSDP